MLTNYRSHYPEYCVTLPISKRKVNYAPYTLQTEKVLVMAADSEDVDEITNTVVNTINDYIRTPGIDARELSRVDCEYLITHMRAASSSERLEVQLTHPYFGDKKTDISIDLRNVKITEFPGFKTDFEFTNYSLHMRLPRIGIYAELHDESKKDDAQLWFITHCVDYLVINGERYDRNNASEDDICEFLSEMHKGDFNVIIDHFYKCLPTFAINLEGKNKDGETMSMWVEGMDKICSLIFNHRDFTTLYSQMWALTNMHQYGWSDLMTLVPWEFDVLVSMIADKIEKDKLDQKQNRANMQSL